MIRQYNQLVPFGSGKPRVISTLLIGNMGIEEHLPNPHNYLCLYHEPTSVYSEEWTGFKFISGYDRDQPLFSLFKEVYKSDGWQNEEGIRKELHFWDAERYVDILLQRLEESKLEK